MGQPSLKYEKLEFSLQGSGSRKTSLVLNYFIRFKAAYIMDILASTIAQLLPSLFESLSLFTTSLIQGALVGLFQSGISRDNDTQVQDIPDLLVHDIYWKMRGHRIEAGTSVQCLDRKEKQALSVDYLPKKLLFESVMKTGLSRQYLKHIENFALERHKSLDWEFLENPEYWI